MSIWLSFLPFFQSPFLVICLCRSTPYFALATQIYAMPLPRLTILFFSFPLHNNSAPSSHLFGIAVPLYMLPLLFYTMHSRCLTIPCYSIAMLLIQYCSLPQPCIPFSYFASAMRYCSLRCHRLPRYSVQILCCAVLSSRQHHAIAIHS